MSELFSTLIEYFHYSFVVYAFITGILIALISALLGVTLVLKRFSFIGDGLSHTAFGALAIATICNLSNNMYLVLPITVVFAIMILCTKENSKIKGDSAIAMLSAGSLAFGYLLLNIFKPKSNLAGDVCTTLFGSTSILTLTKSQVYLSLILSILVLVFYFWFYNRIFAVTFDDDFARASGTKVFIMEITMASMIAIVIVLSMNLVGSLLISALIVFPVMSAIALFKSFKSVVIWSVVDSVFCAIIGLLISILAGTPVGSTIVMADIIVYGICALVSLIVKKRS
ncbi:MAG: metal ABC transporter permease [Treponemataceae bacterium]|nr:metal ABC transporter permease [Treponemataceae bacterium]